MKKYGLRASIVIMTNQESYDKSRKRHYLVGGIARNDDEVLPFEGNEDKLGKLANLKR